MKEFVLDIFTDQIVVTVEDGSGKITCGLGRETCPSCSEPNCCFSCDGSQGADEGNEEDEVDVAGRLAYNGALDGIEALVLAHAVAGINIADDTYVDGIKSALEAAGNNL